MEQQISLFGNSRGIATQNRKTPQTIGKSGEQWRRASLYKGKE